MTQSNTLLFTDKYNALAKSVGVQPEEESVAKFFWYAGLRHAFQRSTAQAALLTPVPTVPLQEPVVPSMPTVWAGLHHSINNQQRYKGYDSELSPYEAKLLSTSIASLLSMAQEQIAIFEKETNSLWKYCDKENKDTEEVFKMMNQARTKLRKVKQQKKTLDNAQRKLKILAKGL